MSLLDLLVILLSAACTAAIATVFLAQQAQADRTSDTLPQDPLALLFEDGILHHGTLTALNTFALFPGTHVWDDLRDSLLQRFPDFPPTAGTGQSGRMSIQADTPGDGGEININWRDGMCWVEICEKSLEQRAMPATTQSALDHAALTSPHPAWEVDQDGSTIWSNAAYDRFVQSHQVSHATRDIPDQNTPCRKAIMAHDGGNDWYEITSHSRGKSTLFHATCITLLVHAEEAQRRFVQTLAKTFAHLSIGLAIFDREGQLAIFNPAMVDLTGLQASYLATRPGMLSFFDALRENRQMPEPKNYRTWRQDIAELIAAASGGQYRETWTLEDGRTYSVQGRPHPDGATAFLIEDISAEVTLARSYRAEVEQFETLLDSVDDALVVFSMSGVLTLCNAAYRDLWAQNPDAAFADVTFADAVKLWAGKSSATGGWQTVGNFSAVRCGRTPTTLDLQMADGRNITCNIEILGTGATLIRFAGQKAAMNAKGIKRTAT